MKTLKFGTDYQACAHSFTYANKEQEGECYGNRLFYENDTIYSYGYHFIIAKKVRNKANEVAFVLLNTNSSTATTNKQRYAVRRALHQKIINVDTDIKYFNPLTEVLQKETELYCLAGLLARARSEYKIAEYEQEIRVLILEIDFLAKYYKIKSKLPSRIKAILKETEFNTVLSLLNAGTEKRRKANLREVKARAKRREEQLKLSIATDKERLTKWLNYDIDKVYLNHIDTDYLRLSKDKTKLQTTQSIEIPIQEAKRLLKLVDAGKIVGATVDNQFKVKEFNEVLTIGCHKIKATEVTRIREVIAAL